MLPFFPVAHRALPSRLASAVVLAVLATGVMLAACSDDPSGSGPDSASDAGADAAPGIADDAASDVAELEPTPHGPRLVLTVPSTPVIANVCFEITLAAVGGDSAAATFPATEDIVIASDARTKAFATQQECSSGAPPSAVPVTAGATSATFYVRSWTEGQATLTATASFATGAVTFTPVEFSVIGQPDARTVRQLVQPMVSPRKVFAGGGRLLVGHMGRGRVDVWNAIPTAAGTPPSFVLGWPNASSRPAGGRTASTTDGAGGLWTDGTRLVIADSSGHRVLVWNTFPTRDNEPASFALGQPAGTNNLTSAVANNGGRSGSSMNRPVGVSSDGTRLFVVDSFNYRVLVWSAFPTAGGQSADFALGIPGGVENLSSGPVGELSGATFSDPQDVLAIGDQLFVADSFNHRVLVWNTLPTAGGEPASFALGQSDLVSRSENAGGAPSASTLSRPIALATDGTALIVVDCDNNRVAVWSALPTTSAQPADFMLGQPAGADNLVSNAENNGGVSGSSLWESQGVALDRGKLVVADTQNHRVLVWNALPTSGGASASFALGQPAGPNNLLSTHAGTLGGAPTDLAYPGHAATDGTRLFVPDAPNHRVLVWNTMPTSSMAPPSFALGQPAGADNLTSGVENNGGVSGSSLHAPGAVFIDGSRLYVADTENHRVLVWNTLPTTGGQPADFALGQPAGAKNLTSNDPNNGGPSGSSMSAPTSIARAGSRLLVADAGNYRVLVWDAVPSTGGASASFALGQPAGPSNMTAVDSGSGAPYIQSLVAVGGKLFAADTNNNRVLVWSTVPSAGGEAATFALGQPVGPSNLTSTSNNAGGLSASSMSFPGGVASDGTRLFVADANNHRILVWDALPSAPTPADSVIGQPSFTHRAPNAGGLVSNAAFYRPSSVLVEPTRLLVSDQGNSRLVILPR